MSVHLTGATNYVLYLLICLVLKVSCQQHNSFITRSDNWSQLDEGKKPTINIVLVFMCFIFVLAAYCIVIHGAVISDSDYTLIAYNWFVPCTY